MSSKDFKDACKITGLKIEHTRSHPLKSFVTHRVRNDIKKKWKILQNKASLLLTLLSLDVSWWGKSRFFSLMSLEVLSIIHIIDVM